MLNRLTAWLREYVELWRSDFVLVVAILHTVLAWLIYSDVKRLSNGDYEGFCASLAGVGIGCWIFVYRGPSKLRAWLRRRKAETKIDKEWLRVQRLPIPDREALAEEVYRGWMNSLPEPLRDNIRFNEIDGRYSLEEYALKQARGYSGLSDWEPKG